MARLKRGESQAVTRAKLLATAKILFARNGYVNTSVDRIAEEAGFSKGAFYSNFSSKDEIFLKVLAQYGEESLSGVMKAIETAADTSAVIEHIAAWANQVSRESNWPLLILEHARHVKSDQSTFDAQEEVLRSHWRPLGERLLRLVPNFQYEPELLGALVFELAHAPAMSFTDNPTAGDLVRLALKSLLTAKT